MTETKPKAVKVVRKKKSLRPNNIRIIKSELVGVRTLNLYHDNPNVRQDLEEHKKSLEENGQFDALIVNIGNKSNYKREVLSGNHTLLAARELGYTKVRVDWVDVDDQEAARIALVSNKLAQGVEFDDKAVIRLLSEAGGPDGTGYSQEEFDSLTAELDAIAAQVQKEMLDEEERIAEADAKKLLEGEMSEDFDNAAFGDEPELEVDDDDTFEDDDEAEDYEGGDGVDIESSKAELPGVFTLKTPGEIDFGKGLTYFGIPELLTKKGTLATFDMLPDKLDVWVGTMSRKSKQNQDPDQWWLYNWGSDNTKGINNLAQTIVGFYSFDDNFENWWWYPDRYVKKLMASQTPMVILPDWSMETHMPKAECLWQLYRARFIGRYIQECGIPVIPNVSWPFGDVEWLDQWVLKTLPKKLPMIAMQLQTIDPKDGSIEDFKDIVEHVFDVLKPESAFIYASEMGRNVIDTINTGGADIKVVRTRMEAITQIQNDSGEKRVRKETI